MLMLSYAIDAPYNYDLSLKIKFIKHFKMRLTEEYYFKNFEPNETDSSMYSLTSGVVA